jgi:hypothetical protein
MFSRTVLLSSLATISLVITWMSCVNPAKGNISLQGRWTIVNAQRNGKATVMLNGAYFIFDTETKMLRTNLRLDEQEGEISGAYSLEGERLIQNSEPRVNYTIKTYSDTTLTLSFETRGFPFEIDLKKEASTAN